MSIKKHFRAFVFNLVALWVATRIIEGVFFEDGYQTLLLAALALTLINLLVRPLIKLLLLPINLLTLGLLRWVVNVIALYLVTLFVPQFKVVSFFFPGFSYQGITIPSIELGVFWVYVLTSFFLSFVTSFLFWLVRK